MKKVFWGLLFVAALLASVYALLNTMVTVATNDFHDYQPLFKAALVAAVVSIGLSSAVMVGINDRWRFLAIIPVVVCGFALFDIVRRWPYVFG